MGLLSKLFGGGQKPPSETYLGLRNHALGVTREALGLPADPTAPIYGIVMELGMPNGVATFVCLLEGSVSLYTSTGGGMIGAGGHESVRSACLRLFELTNEFGDAFIAACHPASTHPLPGKGETF